jgi:ATP/maltotriose-dependent transcriptional regulator MalT
LSHLVHPYLFTGKLKQAEETLQLLEQIHQELPDLGRQADQHFQRAKIFLSLFKGDIEEAARITRDVRSEVAAGKDMQNLFLLDYAFSMIAVQGEADYPETEGILKEFYALSKHSNVLYFTAIAALVSYYCKQSRTPEAKAWLERFEEHLQSPPEINDYFMVFLAKAVVALKENDWQEAQQAFHRAYEEMETRESPWVEGIVLKVWGEAWLEHNQELERRQGADKLRQAGRIFAEMGAQRFVENIEEKLRQVGLAGKVD